MKEMKYFFEKYKELEPKTDNDQLLDNYIKQVSDQQNQIGELQKTIMELREQIENSKRELMKKDVENILDGEGLSDYVIYELVDYILERITNEGN